MKEQLDRIEKKIDSLLAALSEEQGEVNYAAHVDILSGFWEPPELEAWAKRVEKEFGGIPVGNGWRGSKHVRQVGNAGRFSENIIAVPVGIICRQALSVEGLTLEAKANIERSVSMCDGIFGFGPVVPHAYDRDGNQICGVVTIRSGEHAESWHGILDVVRDWIERQAYQADPARKPSFRL